MSSLTRQIVYAWIQERGKNVTVGDVMEAFGINRKSAGNFLLILRDVEAIELVQRGHRGVYKLTGKPIEPRRGHPNSLANLDIGRKRAPDPNRLTEDGKPLWWPDAPELGKLW